MTHSHAWHELIHMCDTTHSHVWHDSFACMARLIHMCDTTHSHVWYDSHYDTRQLHVHTHMQTYARYALLLDIATHMQHTCKTYVTHMQQCATYTWDRRCGWRCKTLQDTATHCNVREIGFTATHSNTLQHTATPHNVREIRVVARHSNTPPHMCNTCTTCCKVCVVSVAASHSNTPQHNVTHCNALQHNAAHCNTMQHTATYLR